MSALFCCPRSAMCHPVRSSGTGAGRRLYDNGRGDTAQSRLSMPIQPAGGAGPGFKTKRGRTRQPSGGLGVACLLGQCNMRVLELLADWSWHAARSSGRAAVASSHPHRSHARLTGGAGRGGSLEWLGTKSARSAPPSLALVLPRWQRSVRSRPTPSACFTAMAATSHSSSMGGPPSPRLDHDGSKRSLPAPTRYAAA